MKRTVLITGASSGFGKETALLFQQQGWNVIATMRSPENEKELTLLSNILVLRLDVADSDSITTAVQAGVDKFGAIDVLINNAGYGLMGPFESATKEQIRKQFDVNVFGLMDVTREVLPHMRSAASGTIINISSFGGQVAIPFGGLYNSSKFAVEGFTEALSHELSAFGIRVKLIEPGGVATNFRSGLEMTSGTLPEYNDHLTSFFGRYAKTTEHLTKATPQQVAAAIYTAATDESTQLRYVVGDDAQFYIDTKYKNNDKDFISLMRNYFIN